MTKLCSVPECGRIHSSKGYCSRHYYQYTKYGYTLDNTKAEFNSTVDKGTYYELILTNRKMEEVGRAKIDKEDLDKVRAVGRWRLSSNGYVTNNKQCLHRIIMNAEANEFVDHKKVGIKYRSDNRKSNLRLCSATENNYNTNKRSDNTSGSKGVSWSKAKNKWRAYISVNTVFKHLGYFIHMSDAQKAYKKAAKKLHKKFYNKT